MGKFAATGLALTIRRGESARVNFVGAGGGKLTLVSTLFWCWLLLFWASVAVCTANNLASSRAYVTFSQSQTPNVFFAVPNT